MDYIQGPVQELLTIILEKSLKIQKKKLIMSLFIFNSLLGTAQTKPTETNSSNPLAK